MTDQMNFSVRRRAIKPTLESLGIDHSQVLLIGGAGLALHGINTSRGVNTLFEGEYWSTRFDVDAFLPEEVFWAFRDRCRQLPGADIGLFTVEAEAQEPGLLPFHGILRTEVVAHGLKADRVEEIEGLHTLSLGRLAALKNIRPEPRSTVGLILGHKDAFHDGLSAVADVQWREQVGVALGHARGFCAETPERQAFVTNFAIPDAFMALAQDNFQDIAFEGM